MARNLIDWAFAAARVGRACVLARLLDQGVSPDSVNEEGDTLLVAAVWERRANCVRLLLERGANPNGIANDGEPLETASFVTNNVACIRELISHGADLRLHQHDEDGYSFLMHSASEVTLLANFEEFLKHFSNADIRNKEDESLLTYAIAYGNLEGVRLLLDTGVDVNTRVCRGETALSVACGSHNETTTDIVSLLMDRGADVNSVNAHENDLVPDMIPLMTFIRCQHPSEASVAVARRIALLTRDINFKTPDGKTTLILARDAGYALYVDMLLELGGRDD